MGVVHQTIFHFQRWHLSPYKRNNKEDVTAGNEGIWPCWMVEVLFGAAQGPPSGFWKVNPLSSQLRTI